MVVLKGSGRAFRRIAVASALFLLVSTSMILLESLTKEPPVDEADALRPVSVSISLYEREKGNIVEIMTGPGALPRASIRGRVDIFRAARLARTRVDVTLYFESEDFGVVTGSVFPPLLSFLPQAKFNHTDIIINVQLSSPMINYSTGVSAPIRVRVWGEWRANLAQPEEIIPRWGGGLIDELPLYVAAKPYHYLDLTFDPPMVQVFPGKPTELFVVVRNRGNGYERVDVSIPGEAAYALAGWSFQFERTTVDIGPRSDAKIRLKVVPPRKFQLKYHMEANDFTVRAVSHYSKFQVQDGDRQEEDAFEMSFMVYTLGLDFLFLPLAWAVVIYLALAVLLLNIGINIFTMRRRKLPHGKRPGFVALYSHLSHPERREERRRRKEEEREERARRREERIAERPREARAERMAPSGMSAPVQELRKEALDLQDRKDRSDDFDIELERPPRATEKKKAPLLGGKGKKERFEEDVLDVLGNLDD